MNKSGLDTNVTLYNSNLLNSKMNDYLKTSLKRIHFLEDILLYNYSESSNRMGHLKLQPF